MDESVSMTTKFLLNFCRRKVIYCSVILISFMLVHWKYYWGDQIQLNSQPELIGTSNHSPLELKYVNGYDSDTSFFKSIESCVFTNNVSRIPSPTVDVSKPVHILIEPKRELYQMIERFSAEDKLLKMNTTFKRILFWNEVGRKIMSFINIKLHLK
jgi:hypothetical protein